MEMNWPSQIWLIRHGQSAGNVARDLAYQSGTGKIELPSRDVDVPLSTLGRDQAMALGRWFAGMNKCQRPDVILTSPYKRAVETAHIFRNEGGADSDEPICLDERLREKEFGILDGLTSLGVAANFPDQAQFRELLGKFYHRPPGGESWCDVIFRLRSLLDTVALHHAGCRVMIFAHQVVILCMRYIIENLDEETILAIDREGDVANCSVTEYRFDPQRGSRGKLVLERYNATFPIERHDIPVTRGSEPIVAARG
ncbi:Broad specificity phosphatase PhoE [Sphingomonas laterariae]|uniref:phosphoglycerate mutase (2,3-diphosphoglycerate-dependent) n=1 Tax=Edaphosphingomonas laterariae TaxID=861865 RepID=A0A239I336_9SPHN|nr:histidine phosphatase family protein [Sphingomonas laterariae]SNS87792.1 Broad specificity phosphatase PhoE [Sphingomonas laterariae]